ncbi:hypothetical protein CCP3SC1AL1_240013 [Gammaproteobacteria bacterium]
MPSFTININGDNYTVGYDGTFNSPQGLLPALNNLGFGTFWVEEVSGNYALTTTDNVNVYGTASTNADPTTKTTTSTTTTSTTVAPSPTSTTTSTTSTSTSTSTTSTTIAPTTSTTTTSTTPVPTTSTSTTTTSTTPPAGPTTTSTTTTTTTIFTQTVTYASNATDACLNPTGTQNVVGNSTAFCTSTIFTSNGFATLPNGNYVLAYLGSTLDINISGFPTITATVTGGGCATCPLSTTTTTTSTTLSQRWFQLTNCNGGGTVYTTNYDVGYAIVGDRVFGNVLGVPSTLVVASVLFSNPGGTQIGIVNSGSTGCPASTTTTTTTTTLPPVTLNLTATCTGITQTITIDNFAGGDGTTYFANDITYADPVSAAAGATSIIVGGTRTYTIQPNGTRYIYVYSSTRNTVKQGGQTCTTTSTTTTTTTIQQVWYAMDICYVGGTANSTNYDIGYAIVGSRVFGTVSGTPRTLVVNAVLTSNPGGTLIGITNSGSSGCPATTSTTTTTTTVPPVTANISSVCTGITQTITVDTFGGGTGTYFANTTTYGDPVSAAAGAMQSVSGSISYPSQPNGTRYVYVTSTAGAPVVKQGGQTCTTTTTTTTSSTTTTTTLPITTTTTTTTSSTTTTTTLPPLVVSNGAVTCSGTTGSFRASFSGGTGTYTFVAIADSPSNAATCVAGGSCGTGGFRVTLGGGATFYDFSGITNSNWYTAVRDSLPQTSVQNTAVSINCTTTTTSSTTTSTTPPPCTTWTVSNFNGFGLGDTVNYIDCSGTSQSTFIGDGNQFDICVLNSGTPTPYMDFGYGTVTTTGIPCP